MVQPVVVGPNKHRLWLQILMCGQGGAAFSAYAWGMFPSLPHGHVDIKGAIMGPLLGLAGIFLLIGLLRGRPRLYLSADRIQIDWFIASHWAARASLGTFAWTSRSHLGAKAALVGHRADSRTRKRKSLVVPVGLLAADGAVLLDLFNCAPGSAAAAAIVAHSQWSSRRRTRAYSSTDILLFVLLALSSDVAAVLGIELMIRIVPGVLSLELTPAVVLFPLVAARLFAKHCSVIHPRAALVGGAAYAIISVTGLSMLPLYPIWFMLLAALCGFTPILLVMGMQPRAGSSARFSWRRT